MAQTARSFRLSENFRSRESLLNFVNSVFAPLMREEIGGVEYNEEAKLKFGSPGDPRRFQRRERFCAAHGIAFALQNRTQRIRSKRRRPGAEELADLDETEKEARLLAMRLKELQAEQQKIWDDEEKIFRAVEWRDMAVLLRALSGKSEIYAKEFERAGVPLVVARGGFYDSSEISDLLSLLQLLDNPLQDVPCIAVLRSPLVGLSLDELAEIRLAVTARTFLDGAEPNAKFKIQNQNETRRKSRKFLERFLRWRKLARQVSLSHCLEQVLTETHYDDWLKRVRAARNDTPTSDDF